MHQIAYSRLRFLVASGDVVTRDTLRVILEAFGAVPSMRPGTGLKRSTFSSLEPDIVFAERDMPLVNGLEMTRLIRLTEFTGGPTGNPYAPVILITKDLRKEDIRDATDAGATEYMVKPLDCEALYGLVEGVVMDPRPFIQLANYFGPDRRRAAQSVDGDRRKARSDRRTGGAHDCFQSRRGRRGSSWRSHRDAAAKFTQPEGCSSRKPGAGEPRNDAGARDGSGRCASRGLSQGDQ